MPGELPTPEVVLSPQTAMSELPDELKFPVDPPPEQEARKTPIHNHMPSAKLDPILFQLELYLIRFINGAQVILPSFNCFVEYMFV